MNLRSSITKKDFFLIVLLLVLIIALPITLFLAQQRQDIRPRARTAQGPAKLFLTAPNLQNLQVLAGQTFTVDLYLDEAGKNVSGVEAHLTYPTDLLEVVGTTQVNTNKFPTVIQNTAGNGEVNVAVGVGL